MGDIRFDRPYEEVRAARDRAAAVHELGDEEVVAALAGAARAHDPYVVNVLATEALNRTRQRSVILAHLAEGVCALDDAGRITFMNRAAERLLGRAAEDTVGRDFHDLVHHHTEDGRDVPREECQILGAMASEEPVRNDDHDVFTREDGTEFVVGFTAAAVLHEETREGIVIIFRDITREKAKEASLLLAQTALDHAPEPVFWLTEDGRFVYANEEAARHLARERAEIIGARVFDIDERFTPEIWAEHWRDVKRAGIATFDTEHRRPDGEVVPMRVSATHVEHDGHEFHVAFAHPRRRE